MGCRAEVGHYFLSVQAGMQKLRVVAMAVSPSSWASGLHLSWKCASPVRDNSPDFVLKLGCDSVVQHVPAISEIPKAILDDKSKAVNVTIPDLTLYCKTAVIKTAWYQQQTNPRKPKQQQKPMCVSQWSRTQEAETTPGTHSNLIIDKEAKSIHQKKVSLIKGAAKIGFHMPTIESTPISLTTC